MFEILQVHVCTNIDQLQTKCLIINPIINKGTDNLLNNYLFVWKLINNIFNSYISFKNWSLGIGFQILITYQDPKIINIVLIKNE